MPKNPAFDLERWNQWLKCPACANRMEVVYYRNGSPSTVCPHCEPERYLRITEEEE